MAWVYSDRCSECLICLDVCPGGDIDPTAIAGNNWFRGEVLTACMGHAVDPAIFSRGRSGGIATALLMFALDANLVDAALVTDPLTTEA